MTLDIAPLWASPITEALRYGTFFKGPHSFTYHPRIYPQMEWSIPAFAFPAKAGPYLLTPEGGMEGWVGLGTTMVGKQSAQDHYVTGTTVISCSDRRTSSGNWKHSRLRASNSQPLKSKTAMLTNELPSHRVTLCTVNIVLWLGTTGTCTVKKSRGVSGHDIQCSHNVISSY